MKNIDIEVWKDIKGYEGQYQVSNLGNVRSLNYNHTGQIRLLKQVPTKTGYLRVNLGSNKINRSVHRLVAEAFLPNPNNLPCINHKDCNPQNNIVDNIEWCTVTYNYFFADRVKKVAKANSKSVKQMDLNGNIIKIWPSLAEAGRNGFSVGNIWSCCIGKRKTTGGYQWSY